MPKQFPVRGGGGERPEKVTNLIFFHQLFLHSKLTQQYLILYEDNAQEAIYNEICY